MNVKDVTVPASVAAAALILPTAGSAQVLLTSDTRLACEAIICLSSGSRPTECSPSLRRYFGIDWPSLRDTVRGRLNFLNLSPAASDTSQNVPSIIVPITNGAGRCDATYLNIALGRKIKGRFAQTRASL